MSEPQRRPDQTYEEWRDEWEAHHAQRDWLPFMRALHELCREHGITDLSACSCCNGVNITAGDYIVTDVVANGDGVTWESVDYKKHSTRKEPA